MNLIFKVVVIQLKSFTIHLLIVSHLVAQFLYGISDSSTASIAFSSLSLLLLLPFEVILFKLIIETATIVFIFSTVVIVGDVRRTASSPVIIGARVHSTHLHYPLMRGGLLLTVVLVSFHILWVCVDYLMVFFIVLLVIGISKLPELLISQIVSLGTQLVLEHLDSIGL